MALHGHTCGIGAAVPGMLHWSGRFTRSMKEQEGRAERRRSQMHGKVDQDKTCPKHIHIYIHF